MQCQKNCLQLQVIDYVSNVLFTQLSNATSAATIILDYFREVEVGAIHVARECIHDRSQSFTLHEFISITCWCYCSSHGFQYWGRGIQSEIPYDQGSFEINREFGRAFLVSVLPSNSLLEDKGSFPACELEIYSSKNGCEQIRVLDENTESPNTS